MKTIWKYTLDIRNQELELPVGSEILTVQVQNDILRLWALVDTKELVKEKRCIHIYATGIPVNDDHDLKYISTFQLDDGATVLHVFEVLPIKSVYED